MSAILLVTGIGGWALFLSGLYIVLRYPENTERIGGWFLRFFVWAGSTVKRQSIKSSLQGRINTYARTIDSEVRGAVPYNMRLDFVKTADRAELSPDEETVIVRIRDRIDDDMNLVHAMLVFCTAAVVPQTRPYLHPDFRKAMDATVTRKLLNSLKHHTAITYLHDAVLPSFYKKTPGMEELCRIFDTLDERGLFTRVVLAEMRDFGAAVETRFPEAQHGKEAEEFVHYVYEFATRHPGEDTSIGYRGRYIPTAFVPVGSADAMYERGSEPYINHLKRLQDWGFRKAYLMARGGSHQGPDTKSIEVAREVAVLAEKSGLIVKVVPVEYEAPDEFGHNRHTILIECTIGELPKHRQLRSQEEKPPLRAPPNPIRRAKGR